MINAKTITIIKTVSLALACIPIAATAKTGAAAFKDDIHPLLKKKCIVCHAPGGQGHAKSGLDMTSYETLIKGAKYGPVVIPGDPFTSPLMMVLDKRVHKSLRMPQKSPPLTEDERGMIRKWIARGARND